MRISKFRCLDIIKENLHLFHDQTANEPLKNLNVTNENIITLFGREYDFDTALDYDADVLFNYCRKFFLRLNDEAKKRGMHVVTTDESRRIHDAITLFLNYILKYLERPGFQLTDNSFKRLISHLKHMRILFHKLSLAKLPNHSLGFYHSTFGTNACSPSFHLVHCHIDFRWQFINILQALNEVKKISNVFEVPHEPEALNLCIEDEILLLMNELMWVSIIRFEKTEVSELAQTAAFPCICIKQLWFLLMHFQYKKLDFWTNFQTTLKIVMEKKSPPLNISPASLQILVVDYLPCKERNVFALWFLSDVIQLIGYDAYGVYVGKPTVRSDYFDVVDDVIRGVLFEGDEPNEASLRSLLPLVHKIQSACQHTPSRPITHLWEFFSKKIHSSFYIPGSKLNAGLALSKSGPDLLMDVQTRLKSQTLDNRENSFLMFLHILGDHLKANSTEPSTRLFSRIFLKFSASRPEKLTEFREQGIHHLSSLFLTMAVSSGNASVVKQLVELLSAIPRKDPSKEGKHEMIVCAITCAGSRLKLITDWSNRHDCLVAGKFLGVLLERSSPALAQNLKLESSLQTIWMRCCFLFDSNDTTKILSQNFNKFCTDFEFKCNEDTPFASFIHYFETEFAFCQSIAERSKLRAKFVSFFPKFDQWLSNQFKTLEAINEDVCENVYRHTAELLTKCPHLIYVRLDSHCLLKLLIDTFILPTQIFRKEYKPPRHVLDAISQYMDKIIEGLLALDARCDPYISRLVREIITHYLPRFASIPCEMHPFLPVISDPFVTKLLLPYLSSSSIHRDAVSVLKLLRVAISNSSPSSILLFNDTSATVLQMLIFLDENHPFQQYCFDYFTTALESPVHRKKITNLLSEALTKHIKTKSAGWFNAVKKLAPLCREELKPLVQLATETILDLEKNSEKEIDPQFSKLIKNLECILG